MRSLKSELSNKENELVELKTKVEHEVQTKSKLKDFMVQIFPEFRNGIIPETAACQINAPLEQVEQNINNGNGLEKEVAPTEYLVNTVLIDPNENQLAKKPIASSCTTIKVSSLNGVEPLPAPLSAKTIGIDSTDQKLQKIIQMLKQKRHFCHHQI